MKKFLVVAVSLAMLLMAASAFAGVIGSKHDLSNSSTGSVKQSTAGLSACQFCHTPHLGTWPTQTGAPLWNRTINAGYLASDGSTNYQVYGAASAGVSGVTNSGTTVNAPGINSKTCLSCHDGTLSIGTVLVGTDATTFTTTSPNVSAAGVISAGRTQIGTDLRQEHPIGVVYDATAGNPAGLGAAAENTKNVNLIVTGNSTKRWVVYGSGANLGKVECGSCHDPHNTTAGQVPFLKGAYATICTDCHSLK